MALLFNRFMVHTTVLVEGVAYAMAVVAFGPAVHCCTRVYRTGGAKPLPPSLLVQVSLVVPCK